MAETPTARSVRELAQRLGVTYRPTHGDAWAQTATRLSGDHVVRDATDDLLVALARAGKISPAELVALTMAHRRELKARGMSEGSS